MSVFLWELLAGSVTEHEGKLVTDAAGRIQITFYDQGLATEEQGFRTFVHELHHIESFEKTGVFSSGGG